MSIQITPLTGSVGASVEGVNLNEPIDKPTFDVLHRAFLEHGVLVYRKQYLQPAAHVAFAGLWGNPAQNNPLSPSVPGFPGLIQVTKIPKETASTEAWHSDSIYTPVPPKISILSAVVVPRGGDTMWCNQYQSYDRLSPTLQQMIQGLRARFEGLRLARMRGAGEVPSAVHPIVRTHPETGRKALYVGHPDTAHSIEGMTLAESRPLLDFLYEHSTTPDNVYRHMWQQGDVVMWDNRCTMHYAVHDYGEAERVLNRITLEGDTPR
ncbi:TauD/TfdA family dioxygenase [Hydrogenophaga sp. 2FB]|uniref:TauD/TfdA dioxygenase family protein n=1 Tax=Hydrogenophaga sp. 2FB TaxID=2502187 RepID=UPI0010F567F6|nr:TauD/TfdA family dioxygenase [Hydrogenophaga sp. 2FB]